MPTGNVHEETWTLRDGEQEVEHSGYRAFRYGELRLLAGEAEDLQVTPTILSSGTVRDEEIGPTERESGHSGAFASSDPDLDRVHELCRYSIEATTLDLYLDTPSRERGPYEGDTYVNQLSHYACGAQLRACPRLEPVPDAPPHLAGRVPPHARARGLGGLSRHRGRRASCATISTCGGGRTTTAISGSTICCTRPRAPRAPGTPTSWTGRRPAATTTSSPR